MKSKILIVLKYTVFTLIGIILLYFAFKGIDFNHLLNSLETANYWWVAFSLVFSFMGYISRAIRWKLLIDSLGKSVNLTNTYHAVAIGYLANFALPRLGEVSRCASLHKTDKVPVDKLLGTVIAERIFDLLMLALFIVFLVIAKFDFFGGFLKTKILEPIFGKFTSAFALPVSVWISLIGLFLIGILGFILFREKIIQLKIYQKVKSVFVGIYQGVTTVLHMKKKGWFIFHTLFIWANYVAMTYLLCFALPSTENLSLIDGVFLLVIGALGMSAPVQGGFGAFHWIVSLGLTLYGLSREDGLIYATLSHESQAIFVIILGAISFFILSLSGKKLNQKKKSVYKT